MPETKEKMAFMKLFVDTNILLHNLSIDLIDWEASTSTDDLTILIPLVVVDELDNHTHNTRLKARARRIVKQIDEFAERGIVVGSVKVAIVDKPNSRVMDELELDQRQNDQWILATIREYRKKHPGEDIRLLTSDRGMKIRARAMGIPVTMLDEKYKLDDESDEQKENRKLRQEIEKLKSSIPKLGILFSPGELVWEVEIPPLDFDKYAEVELSKVKYQNPKAFEDESYLKASHGDRYTKQDAITFNGQLDDYFKAYRVYLLERRGLYTAETLSIEVNLILSNSGNVLAKGIDIRLTFPSSVSVRDVPVKEHIPEPKRPLPPILGHLQPQRFDERGYYGVAPGSYECSATVTPMVDGTTSVDCSYRELKQEKDLALPPFYVTFKQGEPPRGFGIGYSIRSESVPGVLSGTLNVKVVNNNEEAA